MAAEKTVDDLSSSIKNLNHMTSIRKYCFKAYSAGGVQYNVNE